MKKRDFENLLKGVDQLGAVLRGKLKSTRVYVYDRRQVRSIRARLKLSQTEFARMIGVPAGTLRNWEQGIRRPKGPALALLRVAQKHPEAVVDALHRRRRGA
jgi:putative transcriptional regulator